MVQDVLARSRCADIPNRKSLSLYPRPLFFTHVDLITDLNLKDISGQILPNCTMNVFNRSSNLQQQRSTAVASRSSIDSRKGSWSSQPLMDDSDEEVLKGDIPGRFRYRQCSHFWWIHLLLITLYSSAFLSATFFWNYQDSRYLAYSTSTHPNLSN